MYRKKEFEQIKKSIKHFVRISGSNTILAEGDALQVLKLFPHQSVSLILTDPPYHTTKKQNILGDRAFKKDEEYLNWMSLFINEWRRILKPNGSLFCFCSAEMASRLEAIFSKKFNVLSQIVWTKPNDPGFDGWKQKMKKEALRQWYPLSERIIFAEPAFEGNLFKSYSGTFLKNMRKKAGLTAHKLTETIGAYGRVNHGGAVSNWEAGRNIPSNEQYIKICNALKKTGKIKSMPPYRDIVRKFTAHSSKEFTDVWNFPSVKPYRDKHPAEKPLSLLEHAINTTTYQGDIVLDCFAGSGNTSLAAYNLKRYSISIEIDPKWVESIVKKINYLFRSNYDNEKYKSEYNTIIKNRKKEPVYGNLFSKLR